MKIYEAYFIVKIYSQRIKHYLDKLSPLTSLDTICILLCLVPTFDLKLKQLDVKLYFSIVWVPCVIFWV